MKLLTVAALAAALLCDAVAARAAIPQAMPQQSDGPIVLVADGCGTGWYRGPGGACHRFSYGPGRGWRAPGPYCGGGRVWVPGPYGGRSTWAHC
jgi:hypothetical protein